MVKIMSYYNYREIRGSFPPPVDLVFDTFSNEVQRLASDPVHAKAIVSIIARVEGCSLATHGVQSKFVDGEVIPFTRLSTGCKTVLLCYLYKLQKRSLYIDITECGPEALAECLEIIDNSQVTGVIGAPLDVACDYNMYDLEVDGEYCDNWLYAVAAGTETWEV